MLIRTKGKRRHKWNTLYKYHRRAIMDKECSKDTTFQEWISKELSEGRYQLPIKE